MINQNEIAPAMAPAAPSSADTTLALVQKIEEVIVNSMKVPFTSRVVVDEEDIFELIDRIREVLPSEIVQAQQIIAQKESIINEAQNKSKQIIELTKEKSRQYLQEHELVRQAMKLADETRKNAEAECRQQRFEADKYSEEVLATLEDKVTQALSMVQAGRRNLSRNMETTARSLGV
ncbi:hypothetical protein COW36_23680 [bacterium (Candidatus Blackallbacteria) CG17_big_fil_post_rev_8_21_14_2_50_48_46]|uniref:ATPase n=1 Tax=bacterium (Candidatus Blackallbacteria) CG17_big_fil_post_rev_8_21_14_2_50_48_46 TaxID=2014261 RepID=A0A2M7FXP4_9BACT|nr:MAG: hypothetical protein COW64_17890 [bacterium (Candidatus Blackallbacteria) CG18_big_fil_WC_8_21_14_2_50_49_26]PIW14038.1 MAG: hypothetical protein COW36_23680 [bacterium (Candidatus Blackallbacteria) CG17_big_fil_post_rev_8_21_14_2_50_48_46]PIW50742.1 MAG: hypothetical protein COW20_01545 [bacterium (Candidatus Blackallbacteria) CG13_big_fil_rev_8_21_14_2_50_49_14]